jgi:arsenate reductase
MITPYNILLLSFGNACRSQIAKGWCKWYGRPVYDIESAGLTESGIDEYAITVMKEIGIDIQDHASQVVTDDMIRSADIVVTMCSIEHEPWPSLPAGINKEQWLVECPVITDSMSEQDILHTYRSLRDDIKNRVTDLIARLNTIHYENFQPLSSTAADEKSDTAALELY